MTYCIVYRFALQEPSDAAAARFVQLWSNFTHYLVRECGGLGSRLHANADGSFFAYAQWPSAAIHAAASDRPPTEDVLRIRMEWSQLCEPTEVIFAGELIADLFA